MEWERVLGSFHPAGSVASRRVERARAFSLTLRSDGGGEDTNDVLFRDVQGPDGSEAHPLGRSECDRALPGRGSASEHAVGSDQAMPVGEEVGM